MRINLVKIQGPAGGRFLYHGLFSGTTKDYCDMVAKENEFLRAYYDIDILNRFRLKLQFTLFSFDSALAVRL